MNDKEILIKSLNGIIHQLREKAIERVVGFEVSGELVVRMTDIHTVITKEINRLYYHDTDSVRINGEEVENERK